MLRTSQLAMTLLCSLSTGIYPSAGLHRDAMREILAMIEYLISVAKKSYNIYTYPPGDGIFEKWNIPILSERQIKMEERIKLYYNSKTDTPWCDLKNIRTQLKKLEEAGIPVTMIDTASMEEKQIFEHYMEAAYPSVRKQYRIRQLFGTQSKSGQFFGRQQPALLVYQGEDRYPVDVYPHDFNGNRVLIEDFLEEKIRELKMKGEMPSTTYEILDTFTCSVELISGKKSYSRLRNIEEIA